MESSDHKYDAALTAFDAAQALLVEHPEDQAQAIVDLWLEILVDRLVSLHDRRNEPDRAAALLAMAPSSGGTRDAAA